MRAAGARVGACPSSRSHGEHEEHEVLYLKNFVPSVLFVSS
jgi:hypothetical protein